MEFKTSFYSVIYIDFYSQFSLYKTFDLYSCFQLLLIYCSQVKFDLYFNIIQQYNVLFLFIC